MRTDKKNHWRENAFILIKFSQLISKEIYGNKSGEFACG